MEKLIPAPRRAGRPVSPTEPKAAMQAEVLAWISTARSQRSIIDSILVTLRKDLAMPGTVNRQGQLEILAGLVPAISAAARAIESGMKIINSSEAELPLTEDPDQIKADLLK